MLVWSRRGRALLWTVFALVFVPVVLAPLAVLVLAAVAGSWNGVLPTGYTTGHLGDALAGEQVASLSVSLQTAFLAGIGAVIVGVWGALAVREAPPAARRIADAAMHLPIAVPSVVVGLGLLTAFSRPPIALNGTMWLVVIAHFVLVLAFAYSTVSAALERTDPAYAQVAASLGASPMRVLWRVRVPMLMPAVSAAASLSLALSMGEVGATIMVYPASWRPLSVTIFTLTDRGKVFLASAETVVLLATTVVILVGLGVATRRGRR
ncbi:ABC transporter permease [Phytomonospora endophytica]|uniref:2-aminoethylphosphonate transport system permease protein n=1 Tax=Phytomonospora endophytica TaxID=714109 RepID=A0A841FM42_9ACTN|nr:ABC transporter permease subunit [Phytomonospora endophytica]MBB6035983.1 2-aminoethylphosphonate transport system permease protein [Phytomonospora endophytica]GIG66889.1 putative ABC transporter, permease protein [Phytomonospora endophytica]